MSTAETNTKTIQNTSVFALVICLVSFVLKAVAAVMGKTALQYVDCIRSLVETSVVVAWWYLCSVRKKELSTAQECRFNRFVRTSMVFLAIVMVSFSILKFKTESDTIGTLSLGFAVSAIGAMNNFIVCRRYSRNANGNAVVRKQSVLFGLKAASDAGVALSLVTTMLFPAQPFAALCRFITSLAISVAMILGGIFRD